MTGYLGDGAVPAVIPAAPIFVARDGVDDVVDVGSGENGEECEGIHLLVCRRCRG